MIIVLLLLVIEARRYRFFDVYRRRIRTIEQHYCAQIFKPEIDASLDRMSKLGDDLRLPTFVISRSKAFCRCRPRQTSIGGALEERILELILTNPRVEFSDLGSYRLVERLVTSGRIYVVVFVPIYSRTDCAIAGS